jgi:hypothetical protein
MSIRNHSAARTALDLASVDRADRDDLARAGVA